VVRLGRGYRERRGKEGNVSRAGRGGVDVLCGNLRMVKLIIDHFSDRHPQSSRE
jgi:hypothetical protein